MRSNAAGSGGFTLVELMITIAIMAVITAFAVPSYQSYMTRARRSAAEQLMMEIVSKQQQYVLDARSYNATIGSGGLNVSSRDDWTCAATCTNSYYTVTVTVDNSATPPTYTVTGAPQGGQAADGTLTVDSTGTKARTVGGVDQGW